MGWFSKNKKEEVAPDKKQKAKWWQSRSKEEREEGSIPGFYLTGGTGLSVRRNKQWQNEVTHLTVTEVKYLTEEEIENQYDVLGYDEGGMLVVRKK